MIKNKNNKGFTLVEMLAVLVVLSGIIVLAISSFSSTMDKMKKEQNDNKINMIESFAEIYVTNYKNKIYDKIGEQSCFMSIQSLHEKGYLSDELYKDINNGYIIYDKNENEYNYTNDENEVVGKLHSCVIGDIEEYVITFDANGGSVSPKNKKVIYGETYGDLPVPTKSGHEFIGWYTSSSGGSKVTSSTIVNIVTKQKLYARWEAPAYDAVLETTTYNASLQDYECSYCSLPKYVCPDGSVGYGTSFEGHLCPGEYLYYDYEDCKKWEPTTCQKYTCPNGGTLNESTCTVTTYTCPNGGTLSGTTCVFE